MDHEIALLLLEKERFLRDANGNISLSYFLNSLSDEERNLYSSYRGFMEQSIYEKKCTCAGGGLLPFNSLANISTPVFIVSMRYRLCCPENPPRCLKCSIKSGMVLKDHAR